MRLLGRFRNLVLVALCAGVLAAPAMLAGQSPVADIEAQLKGKPLFLRGQWLENKLAFGADGKPKKAYGILPFTLSGIDVSSVKQKHGGLLIEGQRMALEFDPQGVMRRVAQEGKDYSGRITLEIEGKDGADYGAALQAVFAPELESMIPQMPAYWRNYAYSHFRAPGTPMTPGPPMEEVRPPTPRQQEPAPVSVGTPPASMPAHLGRGVTPPKVLKMVEPDYSNAARMLKRSADVDVYLYCEPDGTPTHVAIYRPAGLGLDEQAIDAVQHYKFTPAMKNGEPVRVDLHIDVNFQIY